MNILITGCAGFIGYSLATKLLRNKINNIFGFDNLNKFYSVKLKKKRLLNLKKKKILNFIKSIYLIRKSYHICLKNKKLMLCFILLRRLV